MKPLDLIQLQIKLEYKQNSNGWLVPFEDSGEQALYIVYRHARGIECFFNHKIPYSLGERLQTIGPATAFTQPQAIRNLISKYYRPCSGGEQVFWTGYFEYAASPNIQIPVQRESDAWVILSEGQAVSRAISIRQNDQCAEVYVETEPDFRMRGFGKQVTAAWARDMLISGHIPFYSYRENNTASAALAKSLRVKWFANVVAFEPV